MALDPQAANVIDLIIKSGRPAYHTLSPKEARRLFLETRPASTPPAPQLGAVRDVSAEGRRLSVGGDSAGGNLAAVVALLARDAGAPKISLQVLVYPVTDLGAETESYADLADGYMLTRDSMRWFRAQYLTKEEEALDWRVSPIRATSLAGVAPALVITAGFDPLRDEGEAYARKLREAGVSVDAICFGGMVHRLVAVGRLIDTAFRGVTLIAGSLRQALR